MNTIRPEGIGIVENDFKEILQRVDLKKAKGKKILVTGASGFLGQYVVGAFSFANRHLKLNCTIHAVGRSAPRPLLKYVLKTDKAVTYKQVDLAKSFSLKGYDYIFHAAGYGQPAMFVNDPGGIVDININATRQLLEGSPKAVFVFFGAGQSYGDVPAHLLPVREDYNGNVSVHGPRSVYDESKRLGEALCAAYERTRGATAKIIRLSHVYGPGLTMDDKRAMTDFIRGSIYKKEISLQDSGRAVKTYGYIADVTAMILFVAFSSREMVYNVGGKNSIAIVDLAKKIAKQCGAELSVPKQASASAHIGKDPLVIKLSLQKITREMKKIAFTPLEEGLRRTIAWHRALA